MALAKRKARPEPLFVAAKQLTPSAGHPFNQKLNQLLDEDRVDAPRPSGIAAAVSPTRTRLNDLIPASPRFARGLKDKA